jgi:hypothetical protein
VLLTAAGFTAPDGATGWSDLKADEKLALLKGTYNHFAERFIGGTMKKLKKLRPKAQWGIWSCKCQHAFDPFDSLDSRGCCRYKQSDCSAEPAKNACFHRPEERSPLDRPVDQLP